MADKNTSALAFAILGLIGERELSGYDLRKFFAGTPMRSFSDSPGAIYPALQRLERKGLVRGRRDESDARKRVVFAMTAKGRAEFRKWLAQPVTREDVIHNTDALMLRFAFLDPFGEKNAAAGFLKALSQELAAYIPELRGYLKKHGEVMPKSGRLALESGIRSYEEQLRWSRSSMAEYGS